MDDNIMILYIGCLIIIGYIFYAVIAAAVKKGVKEALYEFYKDKINEINPKNVSDDKENN